MEELIGTRYHDIFNINLRNSTAIRNETKIKSKDLSISDDLHTEIERRGERICTHAITCREIQGSSSKSQPG